MRSHRRLPAGFIEPCIPTLAANPPAGPGWVHEIKHDGYRLIVKREGGAVHLFTRLNAKDQRPLPLIERKAKLAKLLVQAPPGIVYNEHTDEDGATVFRHACKLGLEGIVSKRLSAPYRSGPSRDWIKVKNSDGPAQRHRAGTW